VSAGKLGGHALIGALSLLLATGCRPRSSELDESETPTKTAGGGKHELVEIDLSAGSPESVDSGGLFPLPSSRTYAGLLRTLKKATDDEDFGGIFVRLGLADDIGWAHTEELGRLLEEQRKRGRPVICHAHALSNASTWFVARACDRVWLSTAGEVNAVGIAAQLLYFKRALDKLKVGAEFIAMGKYKSAPESFTREGPSDAAREELSEALGSIRQSWLDGVVASRKAPGVKESLETGPWTAGEAKARGLVDELGTESDARKEARERADAGKVRVAYGPSARSDDGPGISEILRILSGSSEASGGRPHVAVVPAEGAIVMSSGGFFSEGGIVEKSLSKTLRRLMKEDSVKAVVLRIDSPGGSALASDLIWNEVSELRKKKPVVASVGGMAASGGYYIACATNRILAEKTSIVGSIGVFGGKIFVGDALKEFGVDSVTVPANPAPGSAERAAYLSPLLPWDQATRERVQKHMATTYDLFIDRCSKGRGVPPEKIRSVAEGRIWTGAQGKERALVDELGGLWRAIEVARELGKLEPSSPVTVEGSSESLIEMLMLDDDASEGEVGQAVVRARARKLALDQAMPRLLRPFAASFSPLANGERVVAALPFALLVK